MYHVRHARCVRNNQDTGASVLPEVEGWERRTPMTVRRECICRPVGHRDPSLLSQPCIKHSFFFCVSVCLPPTVCEREMRQSKNRNDCECVGSSWKDTA